MRRRFAWLSVAVACGLTLCGSELWAQETEDAEKSMDRGSEAMARGEFKAAIVFFRAAKQLKPNASGPLLGLGLALRADSQCQEALVHLEEYLRRKPGNVKATEGIDACRRYLAGASAVLPRPRVDEARNREVEPVATPWYRRWYVWGGVGAVVVAGVVTGVVLSSGGGAAKLPTTDFGTKPFFGAGGAK